MAFLTTVVVTTRLFKDDHLAVPHLIHYYGFYFGASNERYPNMILLAIIDKDYVSQLDSAAGQDVKLFDANYIALRHFILLTAGLYYRKHIFNLPLLKTLLNYSRFHLINRTHEKSESC